MTTVEEFIEHYGIKGMRWGVRRQPGPDGTVRSATKKFKGKVDVKEGERAKRGDKVNTPEGQLTVTKVKGSGKGQGVEVEAKRKMTDQELKETVNRMQLERQYSQLSAERNAGTRTRGQRIVESVAEIGVSVLKQQATKAANDVVGKAVNDRLVAKGLANPSKKKKK